VAKIEGILERLDKNKSIAEFRGDLNTRLKHTESDITDLRSEIRDITGRSWWLIGIPISMWVTIIFAASLT